MINRSRNGIRALEPSRRTTSQKPLLLLDRDGTLMREEGYLSDPRHVRLLSRAAEGLRRLRRAGYKIVVLTNQSGVGRGMISLRQLQRVNRRFLRLLRQERVTVDGLYWCPHAPGDGCSCRKPGLGLVKRAAKTLNASWRGSISVGDRPSDVLLGQRTKGLGILVLTGYGRKWARRDRGVRPDHTAKDFFSAARWIMRRQERKPS